MAARAVVHFGHVGPFGAKRGVVVEIGGDLYFRKEKLPVDPRGDVHMCVGETDRYAYLTRSQGDCYRYDAWEDAWTKMEHAGPSGVAGRRAFSTVWVNGGLRVLGGSGHGEIATFFPHKGVWRVHRWDVPPVAFNWASPYVFVDPRDESVCYVFQLHSRPGGGDRAPMFRMVWNDPEAPPEITQLRALPDFRVYGHRPDPERGFAVWGTRRNEELRAVFSPRGEDLRVQRGGWWSGFRETEHYSAGGRIYSPFLLEEGSPDFSLDMTVRRCTRPAGPDEDSDFFYGNDSSSDEEDRLYGPAVGNLGRRWYVTGASGPVRKIKPSRVKII